MALMISKVTSSDFVLQLVATETMQGDPRELDNQSQVIMGL